jgi:N utilization substance protein B
MPTVDHVLLHIGLQELLHAKDVPPGVAINEAVALAKEYSTEESGKFVNGILGAWSRAEGPEKKK